MSSSMRLNLARSPFVNRRPVRRLTVALWVVGAAVLLLNVFLIWSHRSGTVEGRAELTDSREAAEREVKVSRLLRDELASMDLASQNAHVDFLNQRIAQRAFPWSRLFDQMVEVMPAGVRLRSLRPGLGRARRGRRTVLDTQVHLSISAQAENGEAMLEFVDRLFAHPAFDRPNLKRESSSGSVVGFQLEVLYEPESEAPQLESAVAEAERAADSERTRTEVPVDGVVGARSNGATRAAGGAR